MSGKRWIVLGSLWAAVGVGLGAFGAHALQERLAAADQLDNWRTAVQYQLFHALALIAYGLLQRDKEGGGLVGWAFLLGSLLFSGSIYLLALELWSSVVWPFTPLGGLLLILGWIGFAVRAAR